MGLVCLYSGKHQTAELYFQRPSEALSERLLLLPGPDC